MEPCIKALNRRPVVNAISPVGPGSIAAKNEAKPAPKPTVASPRSKKPPSGVIVRPASERQFRISSHVMFDI
jgi:hypothetical protein